MSMKRTRRRSSLFNGLRLVESLESRLLLTGNVDLADPVSYQVGSNVIFVATADLDGDENLDLITANFQRDDISVLMGRGAGLFAPEVRYPVGDSPFSIVAADFNDDAILDLATANSDDNTASVLLGNGDGTFGTHQSYPLDKSVEQADGDVLSAADIIAGDLDGDGDLDLVTANQYTQNISVLLGTGDGTFGQPATFSTGQSGSSGVTAGDFDADGDLDVAVANYFTSNLSILMGRGNGEFERPVIQSINHESFNLTNADFNEDQNLDLAVATIEGVAILLGNGDGMFENPTLYDVGGQPFTVQSGDLDADGKLDLAMGNWERDAQGNVSVLVGNGDGTFASEANVYRAGTIWTRIIDDNASGTTTADINSPNYRTPYNVALGDFDNDGDLDVAAANQRANSGEPTGLSVLLNRLAENRNYVGGPASIGSLTFQPLTNPARGSTVSQSSQRNASSGPSKAVDGDENTRIQTKNGDTSPWWQADLDDMIGMRQIVIHGGDRRSPLTDGGGLLVQLLDQNGEDVWKQLYQDTDGPLQLDLNNVDRIEAAAIRISKVEPVESQLVLQEVKIAASDFTLSADQFPLLEFDLDAQNISSDVLKVDGQVHIDGVHIRANLLQGSPQNGMQFKLLETQGASGSFIRMVLPELPTDLVWNTSKLISEGVLQVGAAGPVGDFDGNGSVDFADFTLLAATFGQSGEGLLADADGDSVVGFTDFLVLSSNFGTSG